MSNRRGDGEAHKWLRANVEHKGSACLTWPFYRGPDGYGQFGFERKAYYAHRFMCRLAHGAPPHPRLHAAHSCGNGPLGCVNPQHLSWKTSSQNQMDRRTHGTVYRQGKGGKLTYEIAQQIRGMKGKKTQDELAAVYGVTRVAISKIWRGLSWTNEFKGVSRSNARWQARIKVDGKDVSLGSFATKEEAAAAYRAVQTKRKTGSQT